MVYACAHICLFQFSCSTSSTSSSTSSELKDLNNKKLIVENEEVIVDTDIMEQQPNQPKKNKLTLPHHYHLTS